jgi:hypothetical protein
MYLLLKKEHKNAEKMCYYWNFKNWLPVFKGRSTSEKSVVSHVQITEVVPIYCSTATTKHVIAASNKSCSQKATTYFTKQTITDEYKHIAAE